MTYLVEAPEPARRPRPDVRRRPAADRPRPSSSSPSRSRSPSRPRRREARAQALGRRPSSAQARHALHGQELRLERPDQLRRRDGPADQVDVGDPRSTRDRRPDVSAPCQTGRTRPRQQPEARSAGRRRGPGPAGRPRARGTRGPGRCVASSAPRAASRSRTSIREALVEVAGPVARDPGELGEGEDGVGRLAARGERAVEQGPGPALGLLGRDHRVGRAVERDPGPEPAEAPEGIGRRGSAGARSLTRASPSGSLGRGRAVPATAAHRQISASSCGSGFGPARLLRRPRRPWRAGGTGRAGGGSPRGGPGSGPAATRRQRTHHSAQHCRSLACLTPWWKTGQRALIRISSSGIARPRPEAEAGQVEPARLVPGALEPRRRPRRGAAPRRPAGPTGARSRGGRRGSLRAA